MLASDFTRHVMRRSLRVADLEGVRRLSAHCMNYRLLTLFLILTVCLVGCSSIPKPVTSKFFRSEFAGHGWKRNGSATSIMEVAFVPSAPATMFVEAILPNPSDPKNPVVLRKFVSRSQRDLGFEGPPMTGWRNGDRYVYTLKIYSDADYSHLLDTHNQIMVSLRPPGY